MDKMPKIIDYDINMVAQYWKKIMRTYNRMKT